ncbi:hypothetical protein ACU4GD_44250 [Cupriavidus basilensis]
MRNNQNVLAGDVLFEVDPQRLSRTAPRPCPRRSRVHAAADRR